MSNFPSSPTVGQLFAAPNGTTYIFTADGAWKVSQGTYVFATLAEVIAGTEPSKAVAPRELQQHIRDNVFPIPTNIVVFTANGVYTPSANMVACKVRMAGIAYFTCYSSCVTPVPLRASIFPTLPTKYAGEFIVSQVFLEKFSTRQGLCLMVMTCT